MTYIIRRSLADRKKMIHGLSYEYINEHFLIVDVYAQAGTYPHHETLKVCKVKYIFLKDYIFYYTSWLLLLSITCIEFIKKVILFCITIVLFHSTSFQYSYH